MFAGPLFIEKVPGRTLDEIDENLSRAKQVRVRECVRVCARALVCVALSLSLSLSLFLSLARSLARRRLSLVTLAQFADSVVSRTAGGANKL